VRILSPKEGEVLTINFVHCKYQLVEPVAAASRPTYRVQLDDRDPVRTTMTFHTFTGLKDGPHEIFVIVVDANDTPIPGTRNAVHFKIAPPQPHSGSSGATAQPRLLPVTAKAGATAEQSSSASTAVPLPAPPSEGELPDSGSPLPLLAVLCGGALAGGTLSVIRTRGRRMRK
jgi:hypothetical protein